MNANRVREDFGALRQLLLEAFCVGLDAVHPSRVVPAALPEPPRGRTVVVGAGKASAAMARAIEDSWTGNLTGLVVVPHGYATACAQVEVIEAAHPLPDDFGSAAAQRMLDLVGGSGKEDLVLAVFSGGGSSLLPLPGGRLTLQDKRSITQQLLRAGAPISDINCLRKHLSAIKGGRLARAAQPAAFANILISDVAGDDPSLIASGPGVPDPSTLEDARRVIQTYGLEVSEAVHRHLSDEDNETPKPGNPIFAGVRTEVVACARTFLDASASFFAERGFAPYILGDAVEGEARTIAEEQASLLMRVVEAREPMAPPCAVLSGGEATVTVRGEGCGGPNMEFLLALASTLGETTRYAAISCDTDGSDGSTSAAGALLLPDTGARAAQASLDPRHFLDTNDSQRFFEKLEDLVLTGPTLNNVNDFRAVLVLPLSRSIPDPGRQVQCDGETWQTKLAEKAGTSIDRTGTVTVSKASNPTHETAFTMEGSSIKFGPGVTSEVGFDMKSYGARRTMVVVDPNLVDGQTVSMVLSSLHDEGIDTAVFSQVRIEPTDVSLKEAVAFAVEGSFDGYVAVGGGSTMDTCKVANLFATYPADFMEYVNAPIGKGTPVPGPLAPMVAIPTTAGTGSETTGVAIFDLASMHAKTGFAHRALRPRLGLIDPNNTRNLPRMVVACSGLDVFCHALESLTALPYYKRPAPESPRLRPAYQGANPLSDIWAEKAAATGYEFLLRAMNDPEDTEARTQMILASTMAGIGFGSAGVTLPHGMSYPISGMVRDFVPEGYPQDHPIVPHGMAVTLTAPAAFRFMGPANPEAFLRVASILGLQIKDVAADEAGELVAQTVARFLRDTGMPNGLSAVGYGPEDVDRLVEGALPQHRVTKLSPRPATAEDFRQMFLDSMVNW